MRESGRERTTRIVYAVGWTQHCTGVQIIRAAGILQLLLGNIGRPGGGIMAMRGHASIQGSTDVPTLYDLLPGYIPQPAALRNHETLNDYLEQEEVKTGTWRTAEVHGESAEGLVRRGGDEGERLRIRLAAAAGRQLLAAAYVHSHGGRQGERAVSVRAEPGGGRAERRLHRAALKKLDWLVVRDWFEIETAASGTRVRKSPTRARLAPKCFSCRRHLSEKEARSPIRSGCCSGTTRRSIRRRIAVRISGFFIDLGKRLKKAVCGIDRQRDQGLLNLTWDYEPDEPRYCPTARLSRIADEPDAEKVLKEINGYTVADRRQVKDF